MSSSKASRAPAPSVKSVPKFTGATVSARERTAGGAKDEQQHGKQRAGAVGEVSAKVYRCHGKSAGAHRRRCRR